MLRPAQLAKNTPRIALLLGFSLAGASYAADSTKNENAEWRGAGYGLQILSELEGDSLRLSVGDVEGYEEKTPVIASVCRSYWEAASADEYTICYFEERGTIGEWLAWRTIPVADRIFVHSLNRHQENMSALGKGVAFDVGKVDDYVEASVVVPAIKWIGKSLDTKAGKRSVPGGGFRSEIRIHKPLGDARRNLRIKDPRLAWGNLETGGDYILLRKVPLVRNHRAADPFDSLIGMITLSAGTRFRVVSPHIVHGAEGYLVTVFEPAGKGMEGWINAGVFMRRGTIRRMQP